MSTTDEDSDGSTSDTSEKTHGAAHDLGEAREQVQQVSKVAPSTHAVWWRDRTAGTEVPRTYGVGWACKDGSAAGSVALTTPHAWLDSATIEAKLGPVLTARLGSPVTLTPAAAGESNPIVRLAMAGHRVVDSDLALNYGLDVVGAVVAELRGRGVWALVGIDRYLSTPVRLSVAHWAEAALDSFRLASESDWLDDGWQQVATSRWQLLASQVGHRTPAPWLG